jgi:hypothetical protein
MSMEKYKRDYRFKSDEGNKSFKWLIIILAIIIAAIAYFTR